MPVVVDAASFQEALLLNHLSHSSYVVSGGG